MTQRNGGNLPYPVGGEAVRNGDNAIKELADVLAYQQAAIYQQNMTGGVYAGNVQAVLLAGTAITAAQFPRTAKITAVHYVAAMNSTYPVDITIRQGTNALRGTRAYSPGPVAAVATFDVDAGVATSFNVIAQSAAAWTAISNGTIAYVTVELFARQVVSP